MAEKKKKHKGGGRWIQELQISNEAVEEQEGTFSGDNSAEEIAIELKRKAPDFQAAMGKITLYLNRAGKRLSESRIKELNRVKTLLREMYDRKDRQKANKKKSAAAPKIAALAMVYQDPGGKQHFVDQFMEALRPGHTKPIHWPNIKPKDIEKYKKWLLDLFEREVPYPNPSSDEEEAEDFNVIKRKMIERFNLGTNVPGFEMDERGYAIGPTIVPRVACVQAIVDGKKELRFASEVDALQYFSNLMKEKIVVAKGKAKTFKCPNCESKVLDNTKYCLSCKGFVTPGKKGVQKKKAKEASEDLIFASEEDAIQYLANITGKKIQVAE